MPTVVVTRSDLKTDDVDLGGRERDVVTLTAEERRWGRRRVMTRQGRELALALPTGSVLAPGAVLHVAPDWYVVVEAAAERVLAIRPRSAAEALRVAFEVGNRHFTLAVDGDQLLVPDDVAMTQLLDRLGVNYEPARAVFEPLGHGHRHDV
jgi:urease accessory protein